jgi:hypothetical protein
MLDWAESVKRIAASDGGLVRRSRIRLPWSTVPAVAVLGSSGSGKSELLRQFTKSSPPEGISLARESGRYIPAKKRSAIALTTIPGQIGSGRGRAERQFFENGATRLRGVIFIASFGYDHIWPSKVESAASVTRPYTLSGLRDHNSLQELTRFEETCALITQKWRRAEEDSAHPRWLLVLANKADLWWQEIGAAQQNYELEADSDFGERARALKADLEGGDFQYRVLPIALKPTEYVFSATRGMLKSPSILTAAQCDASLSVAAEVLEELCGLGR